ncbi:hypothetical protein [Campylobacter sp. MG1]|uniref:hypothetical protein n=1 Tax=Campylobacter sp. MG1 TaxID=2976332 RepID=UPI00226CA495|nr:hypothetical protein [Campylobacter sp. MG1]
MRKSKPIRMCIICKARLSKEDLYSFKILNNELKFDVKNGRNLYLCCSCLNKDYDSFAKYLHKVIKNNMNKQELANKLRERFLNGE